MKGTCDVCGLIRVLRIVVNSLGDMFLICKKCPTDVRWEEK